MQLRLHDVDDVFALAGSVIAKSGLELRWHERDDLEAWRVGTAWELSLSFEPGGIAFSTFAGAILRRRVVDWQRQRLGRTRWAFRDRVYERPRPELVSFDSERDRLDETLASSDGDPAADRGPDLERLLRPGDSARARDLEALGLDAA